MGRSFSLFLLRASAILCAGLLLFALVRGAHAGPYDGDNYGLAPLPPASPTAATTATVYNGEAPGAFAPAPVSAPASAAGGGFTPAPVRRAGGPPASLTPEPGFTPAPTGGQAAPPYKTAARSDGYPQAPLYREPLPPPADRPMTDTPPNSTYGFEPSMDFSTPPLRTSQPAPQPAYSQQTAQQNAFQQNLVPAPPTAYRQPGNASTPYGYNRGDGEPSNSGHAQPSVFQPPNQGAAYYPAATTAPGTDPGYILGSGDKIHVAVFDEPDLTGDHAVDGSGFVRLPLIGEVRAAGYTTGQLEAAIGSKLANGYLRSPRVSVQVAAYRPFYVIGAVGRPGEYPYVNHMTVLNAVAMAGGFLPSAVESTVYIRPQGSAHEYRVDVGATTQIHPGDVVRVDTTLFWDAMSLFSPLNGVATIAVAGIR